MNLFSFYCTAKVLGSPCSVRIIDAIYFSEFTVQCYVFTTSKDSVWSVTGLFALGLFAVGHFAVGHFAVRTLRRTDSSP